MASVRKYSGGGDKRYLKSPFSPSTLPGEPKVKVEEKHQSKYPPTSASSGGTPSGPPPHPVAQRYTQRRCFEVYFPSSHSPSSTLP